MFVLQYGSGGVDLAVYSDFATIAGISHRITLGVATIVSDDMTRLEPQGIFGLGFAGLAQVTTPTFFDTVASEVWMRILATLEIDLHSILLEQRVICGARFHASCILATIASIVVACD